MIYLTRDELLDLHLVGVERWGGRLGIRSQDRLLAALAAPQQMMFGVELHPELADKVATLGFQLLKHRPFFGGNEVTALLAMLRMLKLNDAAPSESCAIKLAQAARQVMRSELSREGLADLIRRFALQPRPEFF